MVLFQPIARIWTTGASDPVPWLGLFVIPMMLIPGGMALCYGIGLFKQITQERIKGSVGALAFFGTFWLAVPIDKLLPEHSNMLSLLLGAILMTGVYVWLSMKLFRTENFEYSGIADFIGSGILTLFAFLIWLALNELLEPYFDATLLAFLTPLLIAWLFYRVASRALLPKKPNPKEQ